MAPRVAVAARVSSAPGPRDSAPAAGFHDAAIIEALEPTLWLDLFAAYGEPPGLDRQTLTIEHIEDRLGASGLPEPLQLAIEWIYTLGSPEGCDRVTAAAREHNVDLRSLQETAPAEFIARAAIAAASIPSIRRVLDRAQTGALIASRPTSRVHEFRGRVAKQIEQPDQQGRVLQQRLVPWLDGEGLGDRVDVSVRREDHVIRFVVVRGKRLHAPVTFTASGRRPLPHRPIHCDLLVYDGEANLLAVHASPHLVEGYRRLAGEVFYDDAEHFVASECTLEPLKAGPSVLLGHNSADVRAITLTYVKFRPSEGGTCEFSGGDAFEIMSRLRVAIAEGEFVSARFQFTFYGKGRRPMTVEVQPPMSVKALDDARSPIVLAALQEMGLHRVEVGPIQHFFWELAAGPHSPPSWAALLGASGMDLLVTEKALVGRRLASVSHVALRGAGPVLDVIPVEDDPPFLGESVDERLPSRMLTSSEVEGLALDSSRLALLWATTLECTGSVRELPVPGLHELGTCVFGSKQVQVLLALREPRADLQNIASAVRSAGPVVVLAPRSRAPVSWPMPYVEISSAIPDRQVLRRSIVRALQLEAEVDARDLAGPKDTLIVDVSRRTAWLYGVRLELTDALFLFVWLVALATQRGHAISAEDLTVKLSRKGAAENTARMAKSKAEKTMKQQLNAAGLPVPETIFRPVNHGYEYVGHAFVAE